MLISGEKTGGGGIGESLAKDVAERVAGIAGLTVMRNEVVENVAERMHVPTSLIRRVREGKAGLVERFTTDKQQFALYTEEEILHQAERGNVVLRGWGATCVLRAVPHVVRVRVTRPFDSRVKWVMDDLGTDNLASAEAEVRRSDHAHAARMHATYGVTWGDPLLYDLVVNTDRISVESAAQTILALAARLGFRIHAEAAGRGSIGIALDAFAAIDRHTPIRAQRYVLEHCEFPTRAHIAACARLGVAPTTSTNFIWGKGAEVYQERLGPACAERAIPLRDWLDARVPVAQSTDWEPWLFEFAFGLSGEPGHDPLSRAEPVTIDDRFILRGSVDLVERKPGTKVLRVTDHKTSRNRSPRDSVIGGGTQLQPVIYSLAVEAATGCTVETGRFSYCTTAGGFTVHRVPITERTRRIGIEVLEIIDRAVEHGVLPPAPADKACMICDFRPVCGPDQEEGIRYKPHNPIADLLELRSRS